MSDPQMIKEIMDTVTIPVMAKARIGHFVECQVRFSPTPPIHTS
jgi:pyridoxal 5'-phosphate synthase pdxS subunit